MKRFAIVSTCFRAATPLSTILGQSLVRRRASCPRLPSLLCPVLLLAIFSANAAPVDGTWTYNTNANAADWGVTTNWSGGIIADGGGFANFSSLNITGARNPNLATTSRTVRRLDIGDTNNTHSYTITASGGATLIFDNTANSANAQLNQTSGSAGDTISAPIVLNSSLDITNASVSTLALTTGGTTAGTSGTKTLTTSNGAVTISGVIGKGSGDVALTQNGSGILLLSGANTFGGDASLTSGTITLGTSSVVTSGALASGPLGVGTVHLGSGTNTAVLQSNTANTTTRTISNNISIDGDVTFASSAASGRIALNTLYSNSGLTTANSITLTRTNQLTVNSAMVVDMIGPVSGSGFGITKLGAGTLNIGSTSTTAANFDQTPNTYSGLTTVSAGTVVLTKGAAVNAIAGDLRIDGTGIVQLNNSNQIKDSSNVTLAGGTLLLNNATNPASVSGGGSLSEGTATTNGLGALTLSANSTLDLSANNGSLIHFAASRAQTWTGILSVLNYSGTVYLQDGATTAGTAGDALYFGASGADLTAAQLQEIQFVNPSGYTGTFGAFIDSNGEVFAQVPEPATLLGGLLLVGALGWNQRRRLGRLAGPLRRETQMA